MWRVRGMEGGDGQDERTSEWAREREREKGGGGGGGEMFKMREGRGR